ncbi:MAG TPA: vWA domain-containing protein [Pyrinomonadaceae bacterium]|jgi:Mg-chelatase subunit ChlD|nr:vWA domain-containing protein [Pyrinomonadaceae bacterium]
MSSNAFALKVIGLEFLAIIISGTLIFFYARSVNERNQKALATTDATSPPAHNMDMQTFSANYQKDGKSVTDLLSALKLSKETDLITFVIDTSSSMEDDRQELRDSIKKTVAHYKGKTFQLVAYNETAQVMGAPTRDPVQLQIQLDQLRDLGGNENSYYALMTAAETAHRQFKKPVIILMTDAAPNDGRPGSSSQTTMGQAASALNAAGAELYVFAAFDQQEESAGGSAATSAFYPQLVRMISAGGQIYFLKNNNFDPNGMRSPGVR